MSDTTRSIIRTALGLWHRGGCVADPETRAALLTLHGYGLMTLLHLRSLAARDAGVVATGSFAMGQACLIALGLHTPRPRRSRLAIDATRLLGDRRRCRDPVLHRLFTCVRWSGALDAPLRPRSTIVRGRRVPLMVGTLRSPIGRWAPSLYSLALCFVCGRSGLTSSSRNISATLGRPGGGAANRLSRRSPLLTFRTAQGEIKPMPCRCIA